MPNYTQTGRHGAINGVPQVMSWGLSETSSPDAAHGSATGIFPVRRHGPISWGIDWKALGCQPSALPLTQAAWAGFAYSNTGSGNGLKYSGDIVVDQVQIDWDWSKNAVVQYSLKASGAGALTEDANAAPITDASTPVGYSPCGDQIMIGASGSEVALEMVTKASLTISGSNGKATNSSTGCRVDAKPGGSVDIKLSITVETGTMQMAKNSLQRILLPTDTDPWIFEFMVVAGRSGFQVDRKSGAVVGFTYDLVYTRLNEANDVGSITLPDGTPW